MKEIVEGVWNAPAKEVVTSFAWAYLIYIALSILTIVGGVLWFLRARKKMDKEWDDIRKRNFFY